MTRADLEQRLIDLDRRIEASKTEIWLCERERDEVRVELRRLLHADSKAGAA